MPYITLSQLREYIRQQTEGTMDDFDCLLTELLASCYPSLAVQNS